MAATFGILAKPRGLAGRLGARYVIIDLAGGSYRAAPVVAASSDGEDFRSIVRRVKPYAAITGTFYDEHYRPQGDIVAGGKVVSRGHHRQGIGFSRDGRIVFIERKPNHRIDWSGCESGIASGPRLLRGGKVAIDVRKDGFSGAAAKITAGRCAVGATADGRLVLCVVSQPITLSTMAAVMAELGARDAINLDGGGSCALYENGECVIEPARPMSNILAVYKHGSL